MAERSYRVRLDATVTGFVANMTRAKASVTNLLNEADKASDHLDKIGSGAAKVGIAVGIGLGAAAKAAIDWESAWAGVTKTTDGTAAQMAVLEGQLRNMAKSLPATHQEIAAVAEAAGQLGIARQDIAAFTKVMIDLGETTNLTSDEAATSLAQFMNVMQTAPQDVGRLGASLVALGNDGASTERDILSMATRISSTGAIIGLSETQVLAYASALSNVGIETEAGGSAISSVFLRIDKAVSEGGEALADFAKVSGLSSAQFKQQFETDAAGATQAFIEGLGRLNEAGGDVNGTMEKLGITEIRQRAAVLSLAASGTNLADSLKTSANGWRENTALVDEAAKRYATTESQIRIAWNNIKDDAITAGQEMLPAIQAVVEAVADLAGSFNSLPGPVKTGIVALAGIVGVTALVVGGVIKMVAAVNAGRAAMTGLAASSTTASAALAGVGRAGAVGAGITALVVGFDILGSKVKDLANSTHAVDMGKLTGDLLRLGETGKSTGELLKNFGDDFRGVGDDGRSLAGVLTQVATTSDGALTKIGGAFARFGVEAGPARGLAEARARVEEMDSALSELVAGGNAESAAKAFSFLAEQAASQGVSLDQLKASFPEYASALNSAAVDAEAAASGANKAAGATNALGTELDSTADSAKKAEEALDGYIKALFLMPNLMLGVRDAQRGVQAAIDDATASIKENGRTLQIGTEKGRANQAALDAIATSANKLGESYLRSNASQAVMTRDASAARKSFIDLAVGMGMSRTAATKLAVDLIKIPKKVDTKVTNTADAAKQKANDYNQMLLGITPKVNTPFTNNAAGKPKQDAQSYNQMLLGVRPKVHTPITNTAPDARAKAEAYGRALGLLPESKPTNVSAPGADSAASSVAGLVQQLAGVRDRSATITIYQRMLGITPDLSTGVRVGQADGGYHPHGVIPSYENGKLPSQATIQPAVGGRGLVQWAEPETQGEAFIPLAPAKRSRSEQILGQVADHFGLMLVRSFAAGGINPGARLIDSRQIAGQLGAQFNPFSGIDLAGANAQRQVADAVFKIMQSRFRRMQAAAIKAIQNTAAAERNRDKAKDDLTSLRENRANSEREIRDKEDEQLRTLRAKKGVKPGQVKALQDKIAEARDAREAKFQKELAAAKALVIKREKELDAAKKRGKISAEDLAKAEKGVQDAMDRVAKASDAQRDAIQDLLDQKQAAIDMARQISEGLQQGANIGDLFDQSGSAKGTLFDLQQQAADLKRFGAQISQLRAAGLDEDLIQQIVGKGAGLGGDAAQAILDSGKGMVEALNKAQTELEKQANAIGANSADVLYGKAIPKLQARADGGPVMPNTLYKVGERGPEILRMGSRPGWVFPNAADPNRYLPNSGSRHGGDVRVIHEHHYEQNNQFHGMSPTEADRIAMRTNARLELMVRRY